MQCSNCDALLPEFGDWCPACGRRREGAEVRPAGDVSAGADQGGRAVLVDLWSGSGEADSAPVEGSGSADPGDEAPPAPAAPSARAVATAGRAALGMLVVTIVAVFLPLVLGVGRSRSREAARQIVPALPMAVYDSPDGRFSLSYPQGWRPERAPTRLSFIEAVAVRKPAGGSAGATASVRDAARGAARIDIEFLRPTGTITSGQALGDWQRSLGASEGSVAIVARENLSTQPDASAMLVAYGPPERRGGGIAVAASWGRVAVVASIRGEDERFAHYDPVRLLAHVLHSVGRGAPAEPEFGTDHSAPASSAGAAPEATVDAPNLLRSWRQSWSLLAGAFPIEGSPLAQ